MALRKLQAEIDRTLKIVGQGVEAFESTFEKLGHATNATQKDKLEVDLKTQIKKLQRMRDQIKVWLGNGDIKDKSALMENRKLIESQMERFKALEKEMKMKAFSKEGLIAQNKLDPAEKAKRDMIDWIGTTTDELGRQIEGTEAEAESISTQKKKKGGADRLGELEQLNERRNWHIGRLEIVQRMLENGQLGTDAVETIQEDVKYFLEANNEEDFDFDNGIYDELNLQDEEDYVAEFGHGDDLSNLDSSSVVDVETPAPAAPKTPAKEEKKDKLTPVSKPQTTPIDEQPPSPVQPIKKPVRKTTLESKSAPTPSPSVELVPKASPVAKAEPSVKPVQMPPIRYAAAAAAAVASSAPAGISSLPVPVPALSSSSSTAPEPITSPVKQKEEQAPLPSTESPAQEVEESPLQSALSPKAETAQVNGHAPPPPPGLVPPSQTSQQTPLTSPSNRNGTSPLPLTASQTLPPPGYAPPAAVAESSRAASVTSSAGPPQQGVLGSLMASFDVAKAQSERRAKDPAALNAALDESLSNAPHQLDTESPRYYVPANPIKTPSYYPQARPPILDDKGIFSRLDVDTLMYIFYYMTGTYEQWLAARELKSQSWRFHKQYLTWFQRAHNPQAVTAEYEQGGYLYFDWENSWCQRKKSDFRFEYRWLSDH
ncbi:Not1 N-terminal domain, CCR4-Not complex component-domain-containing protein [Naematelia encephala]|uniref:General negative regulator of transcription subunit n=1 Tax=Naematelia encephala TaxID=71784 RepID=A0A1Y2B2U9_9TREE|nr:Not1 N-terminal domain, CCR4-Not complex component-domain-containing protein [Naematelia encephala]